jgi:hypothetical protein
MWNMTGPPLQGTKCPLSPSPSVEAPSSGRAPPASGELADVVPPQAVTRIGADDASAVKKRLVPSRLRGHSTLAMTMRYMHLSPIALRQAIDLLTDWATHRQRAAQGVLRSAKGKQKPN